MRSWEGAKIVFPKSNARARKITISSIALVRLLVCAEDEVLPSDDDDEEEGCVAKSRSKSQHSRKTTPSFWKACVSISGSPSTLQHCLEHTTEKRIHELEGVAE